MTDAKQDEVKPDTEPLRKPPMPIEERTPGKYGPIPDTDHRDMPDAGN